LKANCFTSSLVVRIPLDLGVALLCLRVFTLERLGIGLVLARQQLGLRFAFQQLRFALCRL
jgi:hypothetical protein